YYISADENDNIYQLDILKEYLSKIDRAPVLSELESIYSFDNTNSKDKNINQILIGYLFTESNCNKELF
ncbi:hypothetical protein ACX3VG_18680, partial [Escherichia coli]